MHKRVRLQGIVLFFAAMLMAASTAHGTVWYVKAQGNGDATSWAHAGCLHETVDMKLQSGDEVWVAAGTYGGDLFMREGVALYAGFAGTETMREQRDWVVNVTTIKGEWDFYSLRGVYGANNAILDGFVITEGYAELGGGMYNNNCSPTVINCTFTGNTAVEGGGMYNINSSPTVTNCIFKYNCAGEAWGGGGAGMRNINSSPIVTNCTFTNNSAHGDGAYGGGMYNGGDSSPTLTNCTFAYNDRDDAGSGGGIAGSVSMTNCIILDEMYINTGEQVSYNCIRDLREGQFAGVGNIGLDPLFVGAPDNLQLSAGSPCIDTGTGAGAPSTDMRGVPRPQGEGIDMGAYEYAPVEIGSLQVIITPDAARAAGARWRVGSGAWRDSGSTEPGILIGTRTVTFAEVAGWTAPSPVQVSISPGKTTVVSGPTAAYSVSVFTLSYLAGPNGSIDGMLEQRVERGGDGTGVEAIPDTGYHFASWSDGRSDNPRTDTDVVQNITVTASFSINLYTVSFDLKDKGTRTGGGELIQTVPHGSAATAPTVTASTGWVFRGWDIAFGAVTSDLIVIALYTSEGEGEEEGEGVPNEGEYQGEGESPVDEGESEGAGDGELGPCGCCSSTNRTLSPKDLFERTLGDWLVIGMTLMALTALTFSIKK